MKPEHRSVATALVAAITFWLTALPGRAQDTIISAAEFQRMVYSGHLLTQFSEKPELDACLQVLLELQRRNPRAAPAGAGPAATRSPRLTPWATLSRCSAATEPGVARNWDAPVAPI